jgi:hypothetical protein
MASETLEIKEKRLQFIALCEWFRRNHMQLTGDDAFRFLDESRQNLEAAGYRVDLDPGPTPS